MKRQDRLLRSATGNDTLTCIFVKLDIVRSGRTVVGDTVTYEQMRNDIDGTTLPAAESTAAKLRRGEE